MSEFPIGCRVRAVRFALDEGQRIWPLDPAKDDWRVVFVFGPDPHQYRELGRGTSRNCQLQFPQAVHGINDNETVPPGTEGTVTGGPDGGGTIPVKWDNGSSIGFTPNDQVELVIDELKGGNR